MNQFGFPQNRSVCMQRLPTVTVCTLCWPIIQREKPPLDGLPQLTRVRVVSNVTGTYHNFNVSVFLAYY